jgi:hypothetical protein
MQLLGPRVRRVGVKCYAGLRRRELVGLASLLLPHYLHAGRDHVMEVLMEGGDNNHDGRLSLPKCFHRSVDCMVAWSGR